MPEKFVVTPWEVKGKIDYDKLIEQFGTKPITNEMLEKIKKHAKELHFFLRRGIFFSHRDLDWVLDKYEKGEKFFLYTGRGPSGNTHLGHLIPWLFTKWLQDKFDVELYFQITEDEKSLVKDLTLEETKSIAYENILDVIAVGFDPKKTHIFLDTEYIKTLYPLAVKISKHITFSTAKAVFGFKDSSNTGIIFFPAIQIAPCFFPSVQKGKNIPCLIPAAIDQDDYWRPARDVAPKLGFYKPAQIHTKMFPSLQGPEGKMSSSDSNSAVFTTDKPEVVKEKIVKYAYSGGQATIAEHRKKGGNPDVDVSYQWLTFFEEDDKKLKEVYENYKSGNLLTGELKLMLIEKLNAFLKEHQKRREKAKDQVEKFMLRD
ncbi:MAG TPA: tryptophan--tRNA ligase [archaeon]|nr:tryptophan--tRNA ligase [archaeon]